MNPTHPAEPPRPRSRLFATGALAGGAVLLVLLSLVTSCSKPVPKAVDGDKGDTKAANPWEEASRRLRKDTDLAACKTVVGQLNSGLVGRKELPQPPGLAPDAERALAAVVPMNPADLEEVRTSSYTTLDAVYLADCFYLRDAARSLDVPGLSPVRRAEVAFQWVCRQVYLNPWVIDVGPNAGQFVPAVPPTYVLRRGYGSGLERAYVFLALLQQMNLDGCLVGPPDAGGKPAGLPVPGPDGKPLTGSPKGPFWAVGVRVENDFLLFDPWWSQSLPGPEGKTATLSQVKASPDVLRVWVDSPNPVWGVSRDDVKKAAVYLTVPVDALSPRMAFFEEQLKADVAVNVAESPTALRDRVQKAVPAGTPVAFWGTAEDPFAYVHVLPEFLPVEEGGRDRGHIAARRHSFYIRALFPKSVIEIPRPIPDPAIERLHAAAQNNYAAAFFVPPTPRERIQRGQFNDAVGFLTDKQDGFARGLESLRLANPDQVVEWCEKAEKVYASLGRARRPGGVGEQRPDTDPDVSAALAAVEHFWKNDALTAQLIVHRATARAGLTESSYLMALAKHEQAERLQLRADTATGPEAARAKSEAWTMWREAKDLWRSYLDQASGLDPFPNRKAHAQTLAKRANELADRGKP
jgi:hypothetical protein